MGFRMGSVLIQQLTAFMLIVNILQMWRRSSQSSKAEQSTIKYTLLCDEEIF